MILHTHCAKLASKHPAIYPNGHVLNLGPIVEYCAKGSHGKVSHSPKSCHIPSRACFLLGGQPAMLAVAYRCPGQSASSAARLREPETGWAPNTKLTRTWTTPKCSKAIRMKPNKGVRHSCPLNSWQPCKCYKTTTQSAGWLMATGPNASSS